MDLETKIFLDSLRPYSSPLSPTESMDLFLSYKEDNNIDAKNELILRNMKLVFSVASFLYKDKYNLSLMDLVSAGTIGLIKSLDKYDLSKNTKFSTYAVWYIRQSILREVENKNRVVRLPSHMIEKITKVLKKEQALTTSLGRCPTDEELARETGFNVKKIVKYKQLSKNAVSLDVPIDEEEDLCLKETLFDEFTQNPNESLDKECENEIFNNIINTLSEKESSIIKYRYGFADGVAHTLTETGEAMSLSKERVRQIEKKAIEKLRHPSREKMLRDILR